LHKHGEEV
jgi:hypothetical protein